MTNKGLRKKWIINRDFQYKFIALTILPMLLSLLTFWISVEILFYFMIEKGHEMNLPDGHAYYELLNVQKNHFFVSSIVSGFVIASVFGLWALVMSHKIAGPLYRLTKHFREFNHAKFKENPPLKFREKDYFQEIPEEVNHFINKL